MEQNKYKKIISLVAAILVWQVASMLVKNRILLASPVDAFRALINIASGADFWKTIFSSSARIAAGFVLAYLFAILMAVLANRFEWVKLLIWPWVLTIKSVPVASFIVLALVWFNSAELVVFVCFMISFPVAYNNILNGLENADSSQIEAAKTLGAGWLRIVRSISIPNISPYLLSAASTGCGMAFKAGVAAEVIALVNKSIGEQIYMSKIYFETANLFAWTFIIILLSFVFEKIFCFILKKLIVLFTFFR